MKEYSKTVQERRDVCLQRISGIEGLEVETPEGAFYMFVRLTDEHWRENDKQFVLQLLHEEHVLLVHGSGFSQDKGKGHVRLVFLPDVTTLHTAFDRIDAFCKDTGCVMNDGEVFMMNNHRVRSMRKVFWQCPCYPGTSSTSFSLDGCTANRFDVAYVILSCLLFCCDPLVEIFVPRQLLPCK